MKPNVLLINCDDMGYGDLGCYGSKVNRTPFIDSLAKEGIRFTSFYSSSPVCSPSRAGLMTGCYPPRVSMNKVLFPGSPVGINKDEYTLGNLFDDNGYKTMIIGKWHCGDQDEGLPTNFGFQDYYGLPFSNDMGIQVHHNGKDPYSLPPLPLMHGKEVVEEQPDQSSLTERYVEKAVEFLRGCDGKPFFLYFAQMHVHLPLYAANVFVDKSINGDYGACMEEVDWSVAALVSELKRLGVYDNTIIIFTSDNGAITKYGASNGHLHGCKGTTWEGGQRVPFIITWPSVIDKGQVCDAMACNIDMLPTFASILGATLKTNGKIDGVDMSGLFKDTKLNPRDIMVYFAQDKQPERAYLNALRKGKWKLHVSHDRPMYGKQKPIEGEEDLPSLFNLEEDVEENHNVIKENPDVAEELMKLIQEYREALGDLNTNTVGSEVRKCQMTEKPRKLTCYDENHPYIVAIYDKNEFA